MKDDRFATDEDASCIAVLDIAMARQDTSGFGLYLTAVKYEPNHEFAAISEWMPAEVFHKQETVPFASLISNRP